MIWRAFSARLGSWLLAAALVLPSLVGLLPMPMRAQAAMPVASQDATAKLLADLAVICTPYGLRSIADHDKSVPPAGKIAHDKCVLCGLAAAAALGVLPAASDCAMAAAQAESVAAVERDVAFLVSFNLPPPGRGPPN
ncbi:MAG: hypothetical protein K0S54_1767 [Alphaproteobacteria bacterium]|jgi:hypothetical protein|nr:hypothetical protein [Alphaproteobacteria bacterium]